MTRDAHERHRNGKGGEPPSALNPAAPDRANDSETPASGRHTRPTDAATKPRGREQRDKPAAPKVGAGETAAGRAKMGKDIGMVKAIRMLTD